MAVKVETLASITPNSTTATLISSVATRTPGVILTSVPTNNHVIWVGDSNVSGTRGIPLSPGQSVTVACPQIRGIEEEILMSDLYCYTTASSQVLSVAYFARRTT